MLRKKAVFRPNLQHAPTKPNQTNPTSLSEKPREAEPAEEISETVPEPPTRVPETHSQDVQEAIEQLTGRNFTPIKSTGLQNSKNRHIKLKDLLFVNPPLTEEQKRHKRSIVKRPKERVDDAPVQISSEPSLAPKVKMGAKGQLVLDEASTVITQKNSIKSQAPIFEDQEDVSRTNYDSFRRRSSSCKWSEEDTSKFYRGLAIFGTDFSMMESMLFSGSRDRTELHRKFKKEERSNKAKVDTALSRRISLTSEELDHAQDLI